MLTGVAGPGQMLACARVRAGQDDDLFDIITLFEEVCEMLTKAGINLKDLFLNADAGFDSQELRSLCEVKQIDANIAFNPRNTMVQSNEYQYFDEQLYKCRTVIEQANAWMASKLYLSGLRKKLLYG